MIIYKPEHARRYGVIFIYKNFIMENLNQGQLQDEEASTLAHFQADPTDPTPSPEDQVEETTEDVEDIHVEEDPEEEDAEEGDDFA
jgi:hypothetical protein